MSFLFWAHIVCWAGLFIYIYSLITKSNSLEKEIDALKSSNQDARYKIQNAGYSNKR